MHVGGCSTAATLWQAPKCEAACNLLALLILLCVFMRRRGAQCSATATPTQNALGGNTCKNNSVRVVLSNTWQLRGDPSAWVLHQTLILLVANLSAMLQPGQSAPEMAAAAAAAAVVREAAANAVMEVLDAGESEEEKVTKLALAKEDKMRKVIRSVLAHILS